MARTRRLRQQFPYRGIAANHFVQYHDVRELMFLLRSVTDKEPSLASDTALTRKSARGRDHRWREVHPDTRQCTILQSLN